MIGIIVEGDGEQEALFEITKKINSKNQNQILKPVYVNVDPKGSPEQIALFCKSRIERFENHKVKKIIVLLDRENLDLCIPERAKQLTISLSKITTSAEICVVIKNKKFENWLIADHKVFESKRKRYKVTKSFINKIDKGKADNVSDAEKLINEIVLDKEYHKRHDAIDICKSSNLQTMEKNSRSFKKFLKEVS